MEITLGHKRHPDQQNRRKCCQKSENFQCLQGDLLCRPRYPRSIVATYRTCMQRTSVTAGVRIGYAASYYLCILFSIISLLLRASCGLHLPSDGLCCLFGLACSVHWPVGLCLGRLERPRRCNTLVYLSKRPNALRLQTLLLRLLPS